MNDQITVNSSTFIQEPYFDIYEDIDTMYKSASEFEKKIAEMKDECYRTIDESIRTLP